VHVIAIVAAWNEERFVGPFLEHMAAQGVETYLIDNESTDRTVEIAESFRGRGLAGLETLPRHGQYRWRAILERKEELAQALDADWFLHADPDEIRLPPSSAETLAEAFARVDAEGFNAVNFQEFVFVPTREEPDHDHPRFQETMRRYYPLQRRFPDRLTAWERQAQRVELAWRGGHEVRFPGLRMYPAPFKMRHYLFLSREHALEKYGERLYDEAEIEAGWHGWRAKVRGLSREDAAGLLELPSASDLREYVSNDELDPSSPLDKHLVMRNWVRRLQGKEGKPLPSYGESGPDAAA
jgi:glycosyltransferase involved in cell wall biosynthesis